MCKPNSKTWLFRKAFIGILIEHQLRIGTDLLQIQFFHQQGSEGGDWSLSLTNSPCPSLVWCWFQKPHLLINSTVTGDGMYHQAMVSLTRQATYQWGVVYMIKRLQPGTDIITSWGPDCSSQVVTWLVTSSDHSSHDQPKILTNTI